MYVESLVNLQLSIMLYFIVAIDLICQARYDDELQVYLKTTGLQTASQPKPKAKKSRSSSSTNSNTQHRSTAAAHGSDGSAFGYSGDEIVTADTEVASSSFLPACSAGNGIVTGGLPHFSQVWSGAADADAYDADKLLAQMGTNGQGNAFFTGQTGAMMPLEDNVGHQVAAVFRLDCLLYVHCDSAR